MKKALVYAISSTALLVGFWVWGRGEEKSHKLAAVSLRKMADSVAAIVAADRKVYSEMVVQPFYAATGSVRVAEGWRNAHGLPLPAQLLHAAEREIQKSGAEFSYTLRSQWAINEKYGPQTQAEQTGLEFVKDHPGENYYTDEVLGGRSYFTAVYPDRAQFPCCIECHNQHPRSPRHDFKLNDVMGAIVVRVPLEF